MDTQISDEQYNIFFGKNSEYYLTALKKKNENKTNFNFAAFLFGPLWMVYRKMYLHAFIFVVAVIAESFAEEFIFENYFPNVNIDRFQTPINIGIAMGIGYAGNWFYLNFAKKKIQKILNNSNDQNQTEDLKNEGGVAWLPVIILIGIFAGLILLALYADGYFDA
jgi:hypothetical protein